MKAIKLLSILLVIGVLMFALVACGEQTEPEVQPQPQEETQETTPVEEEQDIIEGMPNPVVEYDTVEDAVIAVGHLCPLPSIYERYEKKASVINGSLIQIFYSDDQGVVLLLREQAGTATDISGNYSDYPYADTIEINGFDVNVKGTDKDSIILATWNDGAFAHSIDYNDGGHSVEEITAVINEING